MPRYTGTWQHHDCMRRPHAYTCTQCDMRQPTCFDETFSCSSRNNTTVLHSVMTCATYFFIWSTKLPPSGGDSGRRRSFGGDPFLNDCDAADIVIVCWSLLTGCDLQKPNDTFHADASDTSLSVRRADDAANCWETTTKYVTSSNKHKSWTIMTRIYMIHEQFDLLRLQILNFQISLLFRLSFSSRLFHLFYVALYILFSINLDKYILY